MQLIGYNYVDIRNPRGVGAPEGMTKRWRLDVNILTQNKSGIYAIVNKNNGKRYIGSTIDFRRRWHNHKKLLQTGKHHSPHLQRAWNIDGESAFLFVILRNVSRKEDLLTNEQEFIDNLHPEYNVCPVAGSSLGRRFSSETKEKISRNHADVSGVKNPRYGKKASAETRAKISKVHKGKTISQRMIDRLVALNKSRTGSKNHMSKPVLQYSKSGLFIARYECAASAARVVGVRLGGITKCCKGTKHFNTAGGFIWRYADKEEV